MKRSAATALVPFTAHIAEQVGKFGDNIQPRPFVFRRSESCSPEEYAARLLLSDSVDITKTPPFLLAQLKKRLADFNAVKMEWRQS